MNFLDRFTVRVNVEKVVPTYNPIPMDTTKYPTRTTMSTACSEPSDVELVDMADVAGQ